LRWCSGGKKAGVKAHRAGFESRPPVCDRITVMDAQNLLKTRRQEILAIAARNGAVNVRVFGSVARGENRPDSDIDFLVNLEAGRSLLDLARLLRELQSLLDTKVDVVTEAGLRARIKDQVLQEARPL